MRENNAATRRQHVYAVVQQHTLQDTLEGNAQLTAYDAHPELGQGKQSSRQNAT